MFKYVFPADDRAAGHAGHISNDVQTGDQQSLLCLTDVDIDPSMPHFSDRKHYTDQLLTLSSADTHARAVLGTPIFFLSV